MLKIDSKLTEVKPVFENYVHQAEAQSLWGGKEFYGLLMEMGTGKTKVIIDDFTKLFLDRELDGVIIIAPKGCYLNWIDEELPAHLPLEFRERYCRIEWWSSSHKAGRLRRMSKILTAEDNKLDIFCINIEALRTKRGMVAARLFCRNHYAMAVVDESQVIKDHKAKQSRACYELRDLSTYRRIMSGTPMPNGPLDIWGQALFLKPGLLKFQEYQMFKLFFALVKKITQGSRSWEMITGYRNTEELSDWIREFSYRQLKSECLSLPPKVFQTVTIERTPQQEEAYQRFKSEVILEFEGGELTSTSALRTMMKLHQINCGHVIIDKKNKRDPDQIVHFDHNRIKALLGIIGQLGNTEKVLIWALFKQDMVNIVKALADKYAPESVVHYYGATKEDARREALVRFKGDPTCRFLVGHPESAGRSLTLVQAAYSIYYSYSHNLEHYLQSQDRNHRPGQTRTVVYTRIAVRKSIDVSILATLEAKKDLQSSILDDWRNVIC